MSRNKKDRNQVLGGFVWKFLERFSSQGITFLISVILARILSPDEYGLVAMINIFIIFANVFVTGGFTASLIQNKNADDIDFSTMFYCTLSMSFMMYGIIYVCAPYIAEFFHMHELICLTRVYALSLIITSYHTIQNAYIARHMLFRKTFFSTLTANILSGGVGVAMAYSGYGVWALVGQYVSNILFAMITLMSIIPWKPQLVFSIERAKSMLDYGSKILVSQLVSTTYKELNQLIIGRLYTPADLGLFNRGSHLPKIVNVNMDNSIRSVLFPAMSNYSDNPERIKQILRRGIKTTSYIAFFFLTLLATSSKPIIVVLLTDKWIDCVPYMQIFCLYYMFLIISGYNVQAIKALGQGHEIVKLEVYKKPLFLLVIFLAAQHSIMAIALVSPLNALYAMMVNMRPTRKYLGYSIREQITDICPAVLMNIVIFCLTIPFSLLHWNDYLVMLIQIVVGACAYLFMSVIFKVDSFYYLRDLGKEIFHKKIRKQ